MVQKGLLVASILVVALFAATVGFAQAEEVLEDAEADKEAEECGHKNDVPEGAYLELSGPTPGVMDVYCTHKIRPGVKLSTGCTLAWILHDPVADEFYASTAGHCVGYNTPPRVARLPGAFGEVAYTTRGGIGNDFALIRIFDDYVEHINPEMCVWGGPTDTFEGSSILGQPLVHVGHGTGVGTSPFVPPYAQAGVGGSLSQDYFYWFGTALPGDSGSPIRLESGEALGVVTHLGLGFGNNAGTTLESGLQKALDAGKIPRPLELVTTDHTHPDL